MPRKPLPPQATVQQHPTVVTTTMSVPHHPTTMSPTMTIRNDDHPIMSSILPTSTTTTKKGKNTQTITHPPLLLPLMPETKNHPRHILPRHHSTDHHRNWRLSHDIHQCRRRVFQQIMTCLYQMMNVEEVALRYENIIYDGAYSQYDYEDMNSLPERVQHLFMTDASPRLHYDLASSSLEFSLQHRPLSMQRALSLSSLSPSPSDHPHHYHHNNIILPPPQPQQKKQQQQQPAVQLPHASSSQQQQPTQPDQPQGGGEVKNEKHRGTSLETTYQTTSLPDKPLPTVTEMEPDDTEDDDNDVDLDNEIDAIINNITSEDGTFRMDDDIPDDNRQHPKENSDKMGDSTSSCPSPPPPAAKRPKYDDEDHHNSAATKCDDQDPAATAAPEGDNVATAKSSLLLSSKLSTISGHDAGDTHGAANSAAGGGDSGSIAVTPRHHDASTTILGSAQQRYTPPSRLVVHRNKSKSMDYHRSSTQIVMERKVQRLMELYHAARCPHNDPHEDVSNQKCPHSNYCTEMKRLWTHMETCRNNFCTAKHCYSSRVLLAHYKTCTSSICQICQPVRHYITSSSSTTTTSRIINTTSQPNTASMQKQQNHQHDATASPPPQDHDDDDDDDGSHHDHRTSLGPSPMATANVATSHRNAAVATASG